MFFDFVCYPESFIYPQNLVFSHITRGENWGRKMEIVLADERGRITLGTKLVERYGEKFAVIKGRKEVVLVPVAEDPIAELVKMGQQSGIDRYSLKELRKIAREEAEKEVSRNVR